MARALQRSDAPAPIEGLRDAIGDPRAVGRPPGGVLRQSLPRGFPFEAFPLASLHDVFAASARATWASPRTRRRTAMPVAKRSSAKPLVREKRRGHSGHLIRPVDAG